MPAKRKNEEPVIVGPTTECRELVTELKRGKQPEDYLLTRANGEPIREFRGTWETLTDAAGLPGPLLHDFRRSAVRNMIRRGVPQKTAMKVSGHKTDAIFSRYNIVSEADIRDAVRKIEQGAQAEISQFRANSESERMALETDKKEDDPQAFVINELGATPEWRNWQTRWTQNRTSAAFQTYSPILNIPQGLSGHRERQCQTCASFAHSCSSFGYR